jgi:hypothetical protein
MATPKGLLGQPEAFTAEVVNEARDVVVLSLPNVSVAYSHQVSEQIVTHHTSISEEMKMLGIQQSEAQKVVAEYRYAVPAKEQTKQVGVIGAVVVAVLGLGVWGVTQQPESAASLATMVSVLGVVFGGIYVVDRAKKNADK